MVTRIFTEIPGVEHGASAQPMSAATRGFLAFTALMGLLLVTHAFRSVGARH